MAMVWESGLPKNMKMCLLAYADHANDDGTSVYPGETVMSDKTSDSAGNVRRVTKLLIEDGVLVQTKRGYRGQRAEFRIVIEVLGAHIARHSEKWKGAHQGEERRALEPRKARTTATPNHHEPSGEPSLREEGIASLANINPSSKPGTQIQPKRKRDELWDTFTAINGDPATKSERGKYNAIVKKLRDAKVTPEEYPTLVAAYCRKYPGSQPAAATVAERVGEMRHYRDRGPITVPDADEVRNQAAMQRVLEEGTP